MSRVLDELPGKPIIVRLSGHAHLSDRAAVREMARQIEEQTGSGLQIDETEENEEAHEGGTEGHR